MSPIFLPLLALAALTASPTLPDPATYTVIIHVVRSHVETCSAQITGLFPCQKLETVIEGQEVELQTNNTLGILALGDYKAKQIPQPGTPKQHKPFDLFLAYQVLLPDGTTRDYGVISLGPKVQNTP